MRATAVSLEICEASVFYGANRVPDRVSLSTAGGAFIAPMTVADVAGAGRNQVPLGIAYMVGSTVMFAGGNAVVKGQLATLGAEWHGCAADPPRHG